GNGKLMPPADILENELADRVEDKVRTAITERILREAGLDEQVAEAMAAIKKPTATTLEQGIRRLFKREPNREWRDHIDVVAQKIARARGRVSSPASLRRQRHE